MVGMTILWFRQSFLSLSDQRAQVESAGPVVVRKTVPQHALRWCTYSVNYISLLAQRHEKLEATRYICMCAIGVSTVIII